MKSICPHCGTEYPDTPDEYLGMTCECEACHNDFVIEKIKFCSYCGAANVARAGGCSSCGKRFPPNLTIPKRPPVPIPTIQEESEGAYAVPPVRRKKNIKKKTESSNSIWKNIKAVLIFAVFIGAGFFWHFFSSDVSEKDMTKWVREDAEKKLFKDKDFIYCGSKIISLTLQKNTDKNSRIFHGQVEFERSAQFYKRPIVVTYEKKGSNVSYSYGVDFDYSKYPRFLKEDADIYFTNLADKNSELKSYRFVSAENLSRNVARCIVEHKQNHSRAQLDIKVTQEKSRKMSLDSLLLPADQVSFEIINVKEL